MRLSSGQKKGLLLLLILAVSVAVYILFEQWRANDLPEWVQKDFPLVRSINFKACESSSTALACTNIHSQVGHLLFHPEHLAETWSDDGPTTVFLHEYAHLKCNCPHDFTFVETLVELYTFYGYSQDEAISDAVDSILWDLDEGLMSSAAAKDVLTETYKLKYRD